MLTQGRALRPLGARENVRLSPMSIRLVWLFDIDGTLLVTDGAARDAVKIAARECLGIDDELADVAFAGRTDPLILADILRKHGRTPTTIETDRFWASAVDSMAGLLGTRRGRVLPGVVDLLDAIARDPQWAAALLTGNAARMAEAKLAHFGLADRFAFGAFGDEAGNRDDLARIAVARARDRYGVAPSQCVVVGDTEPDIGCARAAGARVVAVATGIRARGDLEPLGPDLLLDHLADPDPILRWARELPVPDSARS